MLALMLGNGEFVFSFPSDFSVTFYSSGIPRSNSFLFLFLILKQEATTLNSAVADLMLVSWILAQCFCQGGLVRSRA